MEWQFLVRQVIHKTAQTFYGNVNFLRVVSWSLYISIKWNGIELQWFHKEVSGVEQTNIGGPHTCWNGHVEHCAPHLWLRYIIQSVSRPSSKFAEIIICPLSLSVTRPCQVSVSIDHVQLQQAQRFSALVLHVFEPFIYGFLLVKTWLMLPLSKLISSTSGAVEELVKAITLMGEQGDSEMLSSVLSWHSVSPWSRWEFTQRLQIYISKCIQLFSVKLAFISKRWFRNLTL